jgi:hypothetical protein
MFAGALSSEFLSEADRVTFRTLYQTPRDIRH